MSNPISSINNNMKRILVECLRSCVQDGSTIVSASAFQRALEENNFHLGTPVADQIVIKCKVTPEGNIDFSKLLQDVYFENERKDRNIEIKEDPVNRPVGNDLSFKSLSQDEKIFRLSDDIRNIYTQFDNGRIKLQDMTDRLQQLGLEITPAYKALLSKKAYDMTYMSLLQALSNIDKEQTVIVQPQNLFDPAPVDDPVVTPCLNWSPRKAKLLGGKDVVSWRDGENDQNLSLNVSKQTPKLMSSEGVQNSLQYRSVSDKYLTTTQEQQQKVVTELKKIPSPTHNMGPAQAFNIGDRNKEPHRKPFTRLELLRSQIYYTTKQLHCGVISCDEFKRQLEALGIPISHTVHRLLNQVNANGSVTFSSFVRAFDDFLHQKEVEFDIEKRTRASNEKVNPIIATDFEYEDSGDNVVHGVKSPPTGEVQELFAKKNRITQHTAQQNHGDLIGWTQQPGRLEEHEKLLQDGGKRIQERESESSTILTWDEENPVPVDKQNYRRQLASGEFSEMMSQSKNLISWSHEATPPKPPLFYAAARTNNIFG